MEIERLCRAEQDTAAAHRAHLHRNPELSGKEFETLRYVQAELDRLGVPWEEIPDGGLLGRLKGRAPGRKLLLRADLDALGIREDAENLAGPKALVSQVDGVCHACGHDAHTAMLLGAAQILKDMEAELPGTVKLMFQPGEELGYGSRTMVEDGVLEHPKVDAAVALHVNSQLEVGRLQYCSGVSSGAMATFLVSIQGRGGHSSEPQKTIDPLNIATQLCSALNALVPKEVDPDAFATLTVGCLNAGRSSNIIPDTAELMVSFRTLSPEAYDHLMIRIPELVERYVQAWRGTCRIRSMKTPSTFCDPAFTREVLPFAAEMLGGGPQLTPPSKGAEDFAHVTRQVPGFYAFLGAGAPENYPLHNPNMVLDERAFVLGSAVLANCAVEWLKRRSQG